MATDLELASNAQVLALINAENAATLEADLVLGTHVSFGAPAALTEDVDGKNTSLVVSSVVNSGYVGDVTVKYDRLNLSGFEAYGPAEVIIPEEPTMQDILDAFNQLYGANLELADIDEVASVIPDPDFDGEIITLTAAAGSYAFFGAIDVQLSLASTPLSDVITVTVLDGLEFPEAEE